MSTLGTPEQLGNPDYASRLTKAVPLKMLLASGLLSAAFLAFVLNKLLPEDLD